MFTPSLVSIDDTIVALASASGPGARGVVRISGPRALKVLDAVFMGLSDAGPSDAGPSDAGPSEAGPSVCHARSGSLRIPDLGVELPCLALVWPTARSYTRQPSVELHTWSIPPLLDFVVTACCQAGARLARPGEFTLRAFLAGRLDLTQAEAVLGVIDAESTRSLQVSLEQLAGGLRNPLQHIRDQLVNLLADVEAGLDFVDEDIRFIRPDEVLERLAACQRLAKQVSHALRERSEALEPPRIVFWGLPNVGKSSLINALAEDRVAVVDDLAGTTRDSLEIVCRWRGVPLRLCDTAGRAGADDPLDQAAQAAAMHALEQADLRVLCLDGSRSLTPAETAWIAGSNPHQDLIVRTKADLSHAEPPRSEMVVTSASDGVGLEELKNQILERILQRTSADSVPRTVVRCQESLRGLVEAIHESRRIAEHSAGDELLAAELWNALAYIGQMTGTVYTEDLLDRLFSRFCIGK